MLATASGGTTYAEQLAILKTEFNKSKYTGTDRANMVIQWYSTLIPCVDVNNGFFAVIANENDIRMWNFSNNTVKVRNLNDGSIIDGTANSDPSSVYLMQIKNIDY